MADFLADQDYAGVAYLTGSAEPLGGADEAVVVLQVHRPNGRPGWGEARLRLSDAASGVGLTATAPDSVSFTTGAVFKTQVPGRGWIVQSDASGLIQFTITSAANALYTITFAHASGALVPVLRLTAASYG